MTNRYFNMLSRMLTVITLLVFAFSAEAQTLVNPGIKLGYRFGDKGGFVAGFDLSIMFARENHYYGFVLATDGTNKNIDFHAGFEYGRGIAGICIGPVLRISPAPHLFGFRVTPYAGILLVPYYNYQFLAPSESEHEIGTYIKFTIPNPSLRLGSFGG